MNTSALPNSFISRILLVEGIFDKPYHKPSIDLSEIIMSTEIINSAENLLIEFSNIYLNNNRGNSNKPSIGGSAYCQKLVEFVMDKSKNESNFKEILKSAIILECQRGKLNSCIYFLKASEAFKDSEPEIAHLIETISNEETDKCFNPR